MFVYSIKAATIKFIGVTLLAVAVLTLLVVFVPTYDAAYAAADGKINYAKISSNEDRINFLKQFSWEVKPEPVETAEVVIPKEFDAVYTAYNRLQEKQGLNLEKYKNKTVARYTYEITNYPDYEGVVYANILIYKNKVIGGDICTADVNGFVHGFGGE